jgi:Fe2+ or Zn2+ uptake regulation protein
MEESVAVTESVADLSNKYVEIRNEREAKREVFEEQDKVYSDQLAEIENKLIEIMLAENTTSMSTEKYTVIKRVTKRYNPTNWDSVYRLVDKYKAYGVLHKRIHDTNMRDFLEQHPEEYPEGLNVDSRYAVTVKRKPSI